MTNINNVPVKRLSLAEEVAARLQELIVSGKYAIGQQLPTEPELMAQFAVGRSSVREAVKLLAQKGLLRVQQGLGTFVLSQTGPSEPLLQRMERADFEELNEVRLLLEVKIAEKAALHRSSKDVEKMKTYLKKRYEYAATNQLELCIQADINFHSTIADASKNEIMRDLYRTVATYLKQSFLLRYGNTESFVESQYLHDALLQSIIDRDPKKALQWATRISTRTHI
ncbi:FadR/GntR family transcriptional regulator [Chitinophaga nivalis]|uniref:FadR family transcriptional regulator n=1 Tax=Chitinophaga nivalis TaxID=2991709 RepID=A0ABT3IWB1_9BACT|nr:FadR/GntR family transcriptional regulator [Chitinophaga nivalis]MCW3462036.1 FadR family transcriptional regulator [Chitinophaga nivalis]MCW3488272.1 FadR family transcriptional regulator [Chitinophaga nivalis]